MTKEHIHILLLMVFVWCGLELLSCSSQIAGNTSETTNKIIAQVVTGDNSPAVNALVRLRRTDYVSSNIQLSEQLYVTRADTKTDEEGCFEITSVEPGDYLIEVTENQSSAVLLSCTIPVNDTTTNLGTQTLKPLASIIGIVDSLTTEAHVQIYGLERNITVDSRGRFAINDLPAAILDLRMVTTGGLQTEINNVKTESADTTTIAVLPAWRYARRMIINTTSSGANVMENVYGFPLLIRLNSTNYDFTQAQNSGQDIRFLKKDGTILSHEIERWNTAQQEASIWVMLDTVYGNNNRQAVMMLWGNPTAAQGSESADVFDTALGFKAVFHFDDTLNLSDATANLDAGTNRGAINIQGIIGGALKFVNGQESYVTFPHKDNLNAASILESPAGCTFSWWMLPYDDLDTISNDTRRHIISKGVDWNSSNDQDWAVFVRHDTLILEGHTQQGGWTTVGTNTTSWEANRWYHISMVYDGKNVQWFVNGEPDGSAINFDYMFDTSDDKTEISIGRHHHQMPVEDVFNGILDEIRIENVRRTASWIKLSYVNQNTTELLVDIK